MKALEELEGAISKFDKWLGDYGERSQDQYDFWANPLGQKAKAVYYRSKWVGVGLVAPFLFMDAFTPSLRRWFRSPQRFPIADSHFAMGYAYLFLAKSEERYAKRAKEFLESLIRSRCPAFNLYGWGYPFDWITNSGKLAAFTPLITTTPYVYEAFATMYEIDGDAKWLDVMRLTAEHVARDYGDYETGNGARACSYVPLRSYEGKNFKRVVNASSYRAFLLTDAACRWDSEEYRSIAEGNLNFVLDAQREDGSWLYATNGPDRFVDHFHTSFVLKNLSKISKRVKNARLRDVIAKGVEYYFRYLVDDESLPKPFAETGRPTLYRRELYDYAESINLALLERDDFEAFHGLLDVLLSDLLTRWQKRDGSFRTRKLYIGWNNVPYHRWGQSQLFRSLCLWYLEETTRRGERET